MLVRNLSHVKVMEAMMTMKIFPTMMILKKIVVVACRNIFLLGAMQAVVFATESDKEIFLKK